MDVLWTKTTQLYPILNKELIFNDASNGEVEAILGELNKLELLDYVHETIYNEIRAYLMQTTVPRCFAQFKNAERDEESQFARFHTAIEGLHNDFVQFQQLIQRVQLLKPNSDPDAGMAKFKQLLRAAMLSQLPLDFNDLVVGFFEYSFRIFSDSTSSSNQDEDEEGLGMDDDPSCGACKNELLACKCQQVSNMFTETVRQLLAMEILDRLCGLTIIWLIEKLIERSVKEMCQGQLRSSNMRQLKHWLDSVILNWLRRIYVADGGKMDEVFAGLRVQLEYFLCETYAKMIIDQFFNIIIEFPDSIPAIDDLKVCLDRLDLRGHLITTIKGTLQSRILHPGVDTGDILTGYVAAIRALRHLDPSGVLLEAIIEPVKTYLRGRQDTVRCVITSLIEDSPSDLAEELAKSEAAKSMETGTGPAGLATAAATAAADELKNWESWEPDPVDAAVSQRSDAKSDRKADIISMVVDIYGSKELFVNEYKNLLAERLLSSLDLNTDREIRNLELLKLRFGENALHSCEVMLKDMSDSKRINGHIHCDKTYTDARLFDISSLILSCQFWPSFKKETLELPKAIVEQFENYTRSYEAYKGNRTLVWRPTNGRVTLEVEVGGKVMPFTVSPIQATIIIHFETRQAWPVAELAATMKITPALLRKKIVFWQTQGLIKEVAGGDQYVLVEGSEEMGVVDEVPHAEDDEDGDNAMASTNDQREEALQVFWSYIVGMLTNLESLPLERIHQMLKMFASHGPGVEFSQQELKNFLQKRVQEQKLVLTAGVYQLPK